MQGRDQDRPISGLPGMSWRLPSAAEAEELRGRWEMKLDSRGGKRRVSKGAVILPAQTERP